MISVKVEDDEILRIPKIKMFHQISIFTIIYSIGISFLFLIVFRDRLFTEIIITVSTLFGVGLVISLMFYLFAMQSISILIAEDEVAVNGSFVHSRKRQFSVKNYTRIVMREYVGARLFIDWYCELYSKRKYIKLYDGDRYTGELLANSISQELGIPVDIIYSKKKLKKQVYMISTFIFS